MLEKYLKKIQELVDSLESISTISVNTVEIGSPATPEQLDTARWYAELKLPQGVEEFYKELNGFHLEWEAKEPFAPNQSPDRGSIQLLPIERIFGSWKGTTWFDEFEGGERFKEVKPFDLFQPEACAAFSQKPDKAPQNEVYFHYFGEDLCATGYDFSEYLDRLIAARGYLYWQLSLCPDTQSNSEVHQFQERMPVLFPDFNPKAFVPGTPHS